MIGRRVRRAFAASPISRLLSSRGGLIVLCYHDVRERHDFTSWLRVDLDSFSAHLEALSRLGTFADPAALDEEAAADDRPTFLITFDDGYVNNLRLAAPVLEGAGVPALFFVSTHHLVTQERFWFDRVVNPIQAARLTRLDLTRFGLREYRFPVPDGAQRWEGIERLLVDLKSLGNEAHPTVRDVLAALDDEHGAAAAPFDEAFRPIAPQELAELVQRRGLRAGSHAHRHEILTYLEPEAVEASAAESKRILEKITGGRIVQIAYPNGNHNAAVREVCARAGFRQGFVASPGIVRGQCDPMRVPRLLVGGYDTPRDVVAAVNLLRLRARAS
jgi:peptidoglycan/xylan/chitin deacetylase (PgdA/CDA1 family)